jgi:branched-chain amino acid aminotransferase
MGLKVEIRPVPVEELEEFEEAGACGTAAIISSIGKIYDPENEKTYSFSKNGEPGKISKQLHDRLLAIQYGDEEDKFGWIEFVD